MASYASLRLNFISSLVNLRSSLFVFLAVTNCGTTLEAYALGQEKFFSVKIAKNHSEFLDKRWMETNFEHLLGISYHDTTATF